MFVWKEAERAGGWGGRNCTFVSLQLDKQISHCRLYPHEVLYIISYITMFIQVSSKTSIIKNPF